MLGGCWRRCVLYGRELTCGVIYRYKRLGDQRYVKHCRDNNFPPPKCGADSVDAVGASGEANDAHAGLGYTVYLPKDETKSPCEDVILEEGLVRTMDEKQTEREFWHTMSSSMNFSVQYANDIEGTASKDFDMWDLSKVPTSSRCLLRELPDLIPGVTTPMLYIGMLFAHFCWHYEDNALYSVNAMHVGAPKTWYVVPGSAAAALEKAADDIFSNHPDRYHPLMHGAHMLMRKTVMMSPSILLARGVPVYRATQRAREMIVTFPRGYHSGFNHGFHTGEAINFAMPDWIPYGLASLNRYRTVSSLSVIDMERLIFDIAHQLAQCKVHSAALPALKSGEGEEDVGNLQASVQQRCAFKHSVLMCRKLGSETAGALPDDKASKASKAETDETTGWKDLMNREDLTAALWAVRALAGLASLPFELVVLLVLIT